MRPSLGDVVAAVIWIALCAGCLWLLLWLMGFWDMLWYVVS